MGSVSKQHTFVWDEDANPDHVNENFDDIYGFVNTQVVHKDGSIAFTQVPTGPAVDPTTDNQLPRKKYVDDKDSALQTSITNLTTTVTTNKTAQDTGLAARATVSGISNPIIKTGEVVGTTNSNGEYAFNWVGGSFPNGVATVVVVNGDANAGAGFYSIVSRSTSGCTVRAYALTSSAPYGSYALDRFTGASIRVNYVAIGW